MLGFHFTKDALKGETCLILRKKKRKKINNFISVKYKSFFSFSFIHHGPSQSYKVNH